MPQPKGTRFKRILPQFSRKDSTLPLQQDEKEYIDRVYQYLSPNTIAIHLGRLFWENAKPVIKSYYNEMGYKTNSTYYRRKKKEEQKMIENLTTDRYHFYNTIKNLNPKEAREFLNKMSEG